MTKQQMKEQPRDWLIEILLEHSLKPDAHGWQEAMIEAHDLILAKIRELRPKRKRYSLELLPVGVEPVGIKTSIAYNMALVVIGGLLGGVK